jgi:5-methylthioribose kinase
MDDPIHLQGLKRKKKPIFKSTIQASINQTQIIYFSKCKAIDLCVCVFFPQPYFTYLNNNCPCWLMFVKSKNLKANLKFNPSFKLNLPFLWGIFIYNDQTKGDLFCGSIQFHNHSKCIE